MPRKPQPSIMINMDRAQKRPAAAAIAPDGERLNGARLVPIEQLTPDLDQPRKDHGAESLAALADSLTAYGVLQPLLVREQGTLDDGRTRYMIVAGGRRYAAALLAGLARLPVVVRDTEGASLRVTQLVENIQRQDLAPLEEARAFQELMDAEGLSAAALAARLHISPQKARDRLLLLSDQVMADAVQRGQITPTTARDVLRMADEAQAPLRASIAEGARVDGSDIQAARATAAAAGVVNPRSKGGGRAARPQGATGATSDVAARTKKHTAYVPEDSTSPTDPHADGGTDDLSEVRQAENSVPEIVYASGVFEGRGSLVVNPSLRASLTIQHLTSADFFATQATDIEDKARTDGVTFGDSVYNEVSPHHAAYVTGAVFAAVAFLEAAINDLFALTVDPMYKTDEDYKNTLIETLPPEARRRFAEAWQGTGPWKGRALRDGTNPLTKMMRALKLAGVHLSEAENNREPSTPFGKVNCIIGFRNYLTHSIASITTYYSEKDIFSDDERSEEMVKCLKEYNVPENTLGLGIKTVTAAQTRYLSAGCARWAVWSSARFAQLFYSKLGIVAYNDRLKELAEKR